MPSGALPPWHLLSAKPWECSGPGNVIAYHYSQVSEGTAHVVESKMHLHSVTSSYFSTSKTLEVSWIIEVYFIIRSLCKTITTELIMLMKRFIVYLIARLWMGPVPEGPRIATCSLGHRGGGSQALSKSWTPGIYICLRWRYWEMNGQRQYRRICALWLHHLVAH